MSNLSFSVSMRSTYLFGTWHALQDPW
jgi:hypothetical protein